jgi:hypothetical protein
VKKIYLVVLSIILIIGTVFVIGWIFLKPKKFQVVEQKMDTFLVMNETSKELSKNIKDIDELFIKLEEGTVTSPPLKGEGTSQQVTSQCSVNNCVVCINQDRCNLIVNILKQLQEAKSKAEYIKQKAIENLPNVDPFVKNQLEILINLANNFSEKIIEATNFLTPLNPDLATQEQIQIGKNYLDQLKTMDTQINSKIEIITNMMKYPREPILEDEIPSLSQGDEKKEEVWWYSGTLKGDDNKFYVLRFYFASEPAARLLFGELTENGLPLRTGCTSGFNVQEDSDKIIFSCSQLGGKANLAITSPDDSHLEIEVNNEYKLSLNFKSRGLPYWHGNGKGNLVSKTQNLHIYGFEDLSGIEGTYYNIADKKTINLKGQGVYMRLRWDSAISEKLLIDSNWLPIHFDQGYAFVLATRDEYNYIVKDAAIYINGKYEYISDPNKIQIKILEKNELPEKIYLKLDASFGKLELTGTNKGKVDEGSVNWLYEFTGKFTYNDETAITLTNAHSWDGYRIWLEKTKIINKDYILNFLNANLSKPEVGGDFAWTLDSYDLLGVDIPRKTDVINYLNSKQLDDGTWGGTTTDMYLTSMTLMFYNRLGVRPAKSLDPFFSTIDTWDKVKAQVQNYENLGNDNRWGYLYLFVNSWVVYKGEAPPWTNEFLNAVNTNFDSWANYNHQRSHLIGNLLELRQPVPRIDDVVNKMLQQQHSDGSWDGSDGTENGGEAETVSTIQVLRLIRNQTTVDKALIDSAISRGLEYVKKCYRTFDYQGKTYAGFTTNLSTSDLHPGETAYGLWALLNPDSDIWLRWFVNYTNNRYVVIEDLHGDTLKVEVVNDSVWSELVQMYHSGNGRFVGGIVEKYDNNWGFRFKPETITVTDVTAEGLQASIRYISENLDYWLNGYAYVSSKVIEIHLLQNEIEHIDNSLEYLRSQYLKSEVPKVHDMAEYVISKSSLGTEIPDKQQIIDYFDSKQGADGSWTDAWTPMFTTHRVLLAYYLLNATPKKSLDDFFNKYSNLEGVKNYILNETKSDGRDVYHIVFGWVIYGIISDSKLVQGYPPWLNDYFNEMEKDLSWTTGTDFHKRTHILYSYVIARRQFPNLDGIINTTIAEQRSDGHWDAEGTSSRPVYHTSIQLTLLSQILKLYPNYRTTEIKNSIVKSMDWVRNSYKTTTCNEKICGHFGDILGIEDSVFSGILSSAQNGLIQANVDMIFEDLVRQLNK